MMLEDGGIVVRTEVDENNQLHYVVEREGAVSTEKASRPTATFFEHKPKRVIVTNGEITIEEKK